MKVSFGSANDRDGIKLGCDVIGRESRDEFGHALFTVACPRKYFSLLIS